MLELSRNITDPDLERPAAGDPPESASARKLAFPTLPFEWPTPPFAAYPAPQRPPHGAPCVVEGLNGQAMSGRLLGMLPERSELRLLVPPARTPMVLRFEQFQRLTLTMPMAAESVPTSELDPPWASEPYQVITHGGKVLAGRTVGHVEREEGLYLFDPIDDTGAVRRSFIPRATIATQSVGHRLGEVLVNERTLSPQELEAALREQKTAQERKLGSVLLEQQVVEVEHLMQAIEAQSRMPMIRLGEALMALGYISEEQLQSALDQQASDRSLKLGEVLVHMGLVSRADLRVALARKMGYPLVDVQRFPVEADALARLPHPVALRLAALPLLMRGGRLIVAVEDPSAGDMREELEFAAQCKVLPVLSRSEPLPQAIADNYRRTGHSSTPGDGIPIVSDAPDASQLLATLEQEQAPGIKEDERAIEQSDNSLVKLINSMILEAQQQGVSDVHIEAQPGKAKVRIRFRKDGVLRPYMELPHTYRSALIARLKIMCDLDISERRKPQDGKIAFGRFVSGSRLELRVATIPTHSGCEDAVLRLLASAKPIPLDKLGLSAWNSEHLKEMSQRPYGMVLCVGPTGSGKTTTLHSVLGYINRPDRKIWTAEDPIEITQDGLRQVQVNAKIGWTFAHALRSFLRADPDVIMVGEIRDKETAQTAVESSLTGHLVLSTLHTNSAPETVTRLLDMGMDPFNFADSLLGVLAQRLVRRLCGECRVERAATEEEENEWVQDWLHSFGQHEAAPKADEVLASWRERFGKDGRLRHFHSKGCKACDHTGFKGRAGLHELMAVTRELRHLIQTGARAEELAKCALLQGMRTLRQDGIEKMLAGVTSIEEVRASSNA
jgi:type II secretory ATPase GspE/PulE/Tfp pilus assembly ATPase PilB-like protein